MRRAIFNFGRDALAMVDVAELHDRERVRREGLAIKSRFFLRPWIERRRTQALTLFAYVRCSQLLTDYERTEARIFRIVDRLEMLKRRLEAARDHRSRVGRVLDLWTERYAKAAALNVDAHELAHPPALDEETLHAIRGNAA